MIKLSVNKSKRLEAMMNNSTWLMRLYKLFADKFEKEWSKEAGNEKYWRRGRVDSGRLRSIKNEGSIVGYRAIFTSAKNLPPHPTKLTVRSGRLIASAVGKAESIKNVTIRQDGWEITRGSTVPYANRQERQLNGQRAFLFPAGQYVMEQLGEKLLQKSLNEALK